MGAFKGALTIRRFRVEEDPPSGFQATYVKALNTHRFHELTPDDEADRSTGWAVCGRLLDTEFDQQKAIWNDYLVATYRIDSLRIPPSVLEAHVHKREAQVLAERGADNLSRSERNELKELVRRELRRKMLPAMKGVDIAWSLGRRRVFVWATNQGVVDEICDLFLRTFGKNLLPEDPYSAADLAGWGERPGGLLSGVEPADFTGRSGR